jgi:protein-tyrosine phosphatase
MSKPTALPSLSRRAFLHGSARVVVLSGLGAMWLSACGGGGDNSGVASTPQVASIENFRDVAGPDDGYPTTEGRRVRRGMFYRSGAFTPSAADMAAVDKLGIAVVYDLRTLNEAAIDPDRVPGSAIRQQIDIAPIGVANLAPGSPDAALAYMAAAERAMISDPASMTQFGVLLTRLASTPGPQVFQGSVGKDRTGWAAALLLAIAGVPLDVIMQDYLLTNTVAAPEIQARIDAVGRRTNATIAANVAPLFQAQPAVLQAGFDQLQAEFGTLNAYLTQGLRVEQSAVDMLRAKLVV